MELSVIVCVLLFSLVTRKVFIPEYNKEVNNKVAVFVNYNLFYSDYILWFYVLVVRPYF